MALHPPHEREQLSAIEIELATAKKYIRDDLKAKFGYEKNKFFYLDLFEYRINNKLEDIAEDLDLEERYDLINNQPRESVGFAFRGHNDNQFLSEYELEGLFGEKMNYYIGKTRNSINGRINGENNYKLGIGIHGKTPEEMSERGKIGGKIGGKRAWELKKGVHGRTKEEIRKHTRKGVIARGAFSWLNVDGTRTQALDDLDKLVEESYNHSSKFTPNSPSWDYVAEEMNNLYDYEFNKKTLFTINKIYNLNQTNEEE